MLHFKNNLKIQNQERNKYKILANERFAHLVVLQ
jgi:hypothetical protein